MIGHRPTLRILLLTAIACMIAAGAAAQETVCIQCHGEQPGRLGEPVDPWRGSIHAANGIGCHSCHGGDPTDFAMAMSPERGFIGVPAEEEIPGFCGRCHVGVKEDYLESAHGQALGSGGPQCVTCHGNHAVQQATPELINQEDCTRCHGYERAEEIKEAVVETDRLISGLNEELGGLHRLGFTTKAMEQAVFAQRNTFHRLFHSVDVEKVREETSMIQEELYEVQGQIEEIRDELRQRKIYGSAAVALLVLAGLLALLIRRTYQEEEQRD